MDADERQIYHYLTFRTGQFVGLRDICRDAGGKRRCRYAPEWALPALQRMVERGILDCDGKAGYRLRPMPEEQTKGRLWVSPKHAGILKTCGKDFNGLVKLQNQDDYYDSL